MEVPLVDDLSTHLKHDLLVALWQIDTTSLQKCCKGYFDPYWTYYQETCAHALNEGGRHNAARSHQDILDLTRRMIDGKEREELQETIRAGLTKVHANEAEIVDSTINLAASLLLMIECGGTQHGYSGNEQLEWASGTLQHCISAYFKPLVQLGHDGVKLSRNFNARNLDKIANVKIVPTTNLLDHLRLTDDDTKVYVFHHAAFLKIQPEKSVKICRQVATRTDIASSPLPKDVINETLRTLALLFPENDAPSRRWCRRLPDFRSMDPQVLFCGYLKTDNRQIEKFVHWHDRLVVLKQVFDEATPRTLSQWWHDRRNGVQWWTFWVAIVVLSLTLMFGFIQCITGIMQVYAAFHPAQEV